MRTYKTQFILQKKEEEKKEETLKTFHTQHTAHRTTLRTYKPQIV